MSEPITISSIEFFVQQHYYQVLLSAPSTPVNFSYTGVQVPAGAGFNIGHQYVYVDGYYPNRGGFYSTFLYLRFTLAAARNSIIVDAKLSFPSAANPTVYDWNWEFRGVASDNCPSPMGGSLYPNNPPAYGAVARTNASVIWPITGPSPAYGVPYITPDLGSILTEIVARPGWISGNKVGLFLAGQGVTNLSQYYGANYSALFPPYGPMNNRSFVFAGTTGEGVSGRIYTKAYIYG